MRPVVALAILLELGTTSLANAAIQGIVLSDPSRVSSTYGLSIAIRKGQQVVLSQNYVASQVLAVVNARFEVLAPVLREMSRRDFGEAAYTDHIRDSVDEWKETFGKYTEELGARESALLRGAGITLEKYREVLIRSQRYNVLPRNRGSSALRLRVIDGRGILAVPGSLIVLRREDHVYEWGWLYHLPFPSYQERGRQLVTTQELAVIENVVKALGVQVKYFPLDPSDPLLAHPEAIIEAGRWLTESGKMQQRLR